MVFAGQSVTTIVQNIFFKVIPPWSWGYDAGGIVGATASRRVATVFRILDIETEIGAAKRFGNQTEGEFWGAIYFRYTEFPWNSFIYTTVAGSIGLNYATGVSAIEMEYGKLDPPGGTHVMHFYSPEITFSLPKHWTNNSSSVCTIAPAPMASSAARSAARLT